MRGYTLLEACLAFGVLSFGLLALARLQAELAISVEGSRERAQAVRLAQAALETQRLRAALAPEGGTPSPDATAPPDGTAAASPPSARPMTVTLGLVAHPARRHQEVHVTVSWRDRRGRPQSVRLDTLLAIEPP